MKDKIRKSCPECGYALQKRDSSRGIGVSCPNCGFLEMVKKNFRKERSAKESLKNGDADI